MAKIAFKQKKKSKENKLRQFLPLFLLLIFFAALALFWNNISWVASTDIWRQQLSDAFPQLFPRPYVLVVPPLSVPLPKLPAVRQQGTSGTRDQGGMLPKAGNVGSGTAPRRDMITIPKINITAPIITAKTSDTNVVHSLLDSGVVLYPGSAIFGQAGQTVILGHSAPAGWPKIKYDWVFSKIGELNKGDMVVITYNYETRYYQVVGSRVVTPQEGVPEATVSGNSLMLVSCWPPGKDLKRIAVEATVTEN